jgi:hypothetical protein
MERLRALTFHEILIIEGGTISCTRPRRFCARRLLVAIAMLLLQHAQAYSVLSHEAVVDSLWDDRIRPLLLSRFPNTSPEQLRAAHGYAYGGAIIQDMGYYPYGSHFFSDLTHYVRSGDFVVNLINESHDVNEFAFALGALSHYVSDDVGHPLGTNKVVPLLYPKLRKKYGDVITFEDDPVAHVQTEFGFDVLEVAKGRFAEPEYHNFIGFEVARPVLERAFRDTYSLELTDIFDDLDRTIGSYRRAVSKTIPLATKIAWAHREDEITKTQPGITRDRFLYNLSRSSYEKEWGTKYERPGLGDRFLAFILKLIPKIGPLRSLTLRLPDAQGEQLFMKSFNISLNRFRTTLDSVHQGKLKQLPDTNFDVGLPTKPASYKLADKTYAEFLHRLAKKNFRGLDEPVRSKILSYYSDTSLPFATKNNEKEWRRVLSELRELKATGSLVSHSVAHNSVR